VSQMKKLLGLLLMAGVMALSSSAISQQAALTAELKERIAPVGSVCMSGEPCAAAPVAAAASGPRSGQEVFQASCNVCHGAGVAGAPKLGDVADWGARLGRGGIETLYTHAINGFNGMPAMGLCATCSEDEIKATVDYMVENSK
jgi:cytochrome c5